MLVSSLALLGLGRGAKNLTVLVVPLAISIGLALFQQCNLGIALESVSLSSAEYWRESSEAGKDVAELQAELAGPVPSTISIYPAETLNMATMLAAATAIVVVSGQFLANRWIRLVAYFVFMLNGAAFAFFGISQQMNWQGELYGKYFLDAGGKPFAAFVNGNNAGGYLNLCLAMGLGVVLSLFYRDIPPDRQLGIWTKVKNEFLHQLGGLNATKLLSMLAVILIVAGVFCTMSRGAWLALASGVVATIGMMGRRRRRLGFLGVVVGLCVSWGLLSWLNRTNDVRRGLEEFSAQIASPSDARLEHWPAGIDAGLNSWAMGNGIGTYRYAYRPFAGREEVWFYHAENHFVETWSDGGLLGLLLLLCAIGLTARSCLRLANDPTREYRICGSVGLFALTSQVVHSLFDFGLYLPANMACFALICGMVTGTDAVRHRGTDSSASAWTTTIVATLFGIILLGASRIHAAEEVEIALRDIEKLEYEQASLEQVTQHIHDLQRALVSAHYHAEGQQKIGRLWTRRYQLQTLAILRDHAPEQTPDSQLLNLTEPLAVHKAIFRYEKENDTQQLSNLRQGIAIQSNLRHAAKAFAMASRSCAVTPKARLKLGEIAPIVWPSASKVDWFGGIARQAGGNTGVLRECAVAQFQANFTDEALETLHQAATKDVAQLEESLRLARAYVGPDETLKITASITPQILVKVAESDYLKRDQELKHSLLAHVTKLVASVPLDPADRTHLRGQIATLNGEAHRAILLFDKAVKARPNNTSWRYELAKLLRDEGRYREGKRHARICVGMEPDNEPYQDLLHEFSRPRTNDEATDGG